MKKVKPPTVKEKYSAPISDGKIKLKIWNVIRANETTKVQDIKKFIKILLIFSILEENDEAEMIIIVKYRAPRGSSGNMEIRMT